MWLIFCQQRLWPVVELLKYPLATSQSCIVPFPVRVCESESHIVLSDSLWPHSLYSPWNSLDQNTGVGSLSLLQGIFPTQGSNPGLPHCRQILYQLSQGKHIQYSMSNLIPLKQRSFLKFFDCFVLFWPNVECWVYCLLYFDKEHQWESMRS